MGIKVKSIGLIGAGMLVGIAASLQYSAVAQKAAGAPLPLEELRQLADVYGLIKSDYVEAVDDKKLLTEAMSGMVSSLDPHSSYLDKKAYKEMRESMRGKFVGLGIEVGVEDGYIKVVAPIEDSPAAKAGVLGGDLITRIDNVPLKGLTIDESIKKMRGEPHTLITLTVARKGEDKPLNFPIVREEIRVQSVKTKMLEPGYAWVRIVQFQEPTVDDMVRKINLLYAKDAHLKGIVLDLRNDPGGVVPGAIGVSAAFLPQNSVIVSTNGQLPESKETFYGRREYYTTRSGAGDPLAKLPAALKTVKLVVLITTGSASASEIVAGALQDYKRAAILGTQSFGKGSVQTLRQLTADTAVKLTTARYYTPTGRSIQARGIVPDLLVDEYADGDGMNALRMREVDLKKHLESGDQADAAAMADAQGENRDDLEEERRIAALQKKRKAVEYGTADDFQLNQALNHLKGLPVQLAKLDKATLRAASKPVLPEAALPTSDVQPTVKPEDKKAPATR